jgi:hypothetical protein
MLTILFFIIPKEAAANGGIPSELRMTLVRNVGITLGLCHHPTKKRVDVGDMLP